MTIMQRISVCVWTIGVIILASASSHAGDKKAYEKHDQAALYNSLRDVINTGARMYNEDGDHAGCFHLFKGSLISVKPFLAADLQKNIDVALAKCDSLPSYGERAFELRKVLDDIRVKSKPGEGATTTKTKTAEPGQVSGKLTYQGKPVGGGYFITLVSTGGKKYSSALQKDGSFTFKTPLPVGDYRIAIEPIPGEKLSSTLPTRYGAEVTSGLTISVQAGKQQIDLNLVN